AARRIEVRHLVDEVSRGVKTALDRATADGNISREEAIDVRNLAKGLRGKIRARLRAEKAEGHEHRTAKKDKAKDSAKDKAKDDKKDAKRDAKTDAKTDEARASKKGSDPYGAEAQPSSS